MRPFIKPVVLLSKSRDGEILNSFLSSIGVESVRGSSSRGGASAIKELIKGFSDYSLLIAVDGPRGPALVIKPGGEFIAEQASKKKVGVFVTVDRSWRLNSWDKTLIPKPFAKLEINLFEIKDDLEKELLDRETKSY